ncbi:YkvA family protein [Sporolactobacillus laevolacticus]|uniref:DUF1232 domain-containing protein n=1 Tax=Sporolactobacillus laevolacticus DSM 442 TaxID=1395513 RepID=V6J0D5_9BACL|nr:YkvA family protein [Sporolactobacillus laevolacticus]EST13265.1 hypothetical protein P343_00180 [Sporolactobacillus laevolacticus DSM 442]
MVKTKVLERIKGSAKKLKRELFVLLLAYKDSRVPWYAKVFSILIVAYAFSPIDLIPDFIPILGYIDDLILIPLGISLALKMIPQSIIEDLRIQANEIKHKEKPKNWFVGILFVTLWILVAIWFGRLIYQLSSRA